MVYLRKGEINELNVAMDIIHEGQRHLMEQGIDQWQGGYPSEELVASDLDAGRGYFLCKDEAVLGYLVIDFDGEPAYNKIDGKWLTNGDYVIVHRFALKSNARSKGMASKTFELVSAIAREKGVHSLKIDTSPENKKMVHLLEKNGFSYCGIIFYEGERVAYEKEI